MSILIRETPVRDEGVEERGERKGESGANSKRTFGLSFMNINDVALAGCGAPVLHIKAESGNAVSGSKGRRDWLGLAVQRCFRRKHGISW